MENNSIKNILRLSFGEELANTITHGVMSALVLFVLPFCSVYSYLKYDVVATIGVSIFLISIFLMFLTSTLYHCMSYDTKHKFVFRILDHIFIFVAIAGSYTPVALSIIGGWKGIVVLIIQWSMVIVGILYKSIIQKSIPKLSVTIYLVMGWTALAFIPTLYRNSNSWFLFYIVLGGILYSIGAYFYSKKSLKYHHMIWHLFINVAALCHFVAIVFYL